jgi:hypothetical protein
MTPEDEMPEQRIKHLEMVQAVIARLGNDSFLVKGWAVTIAGIFLGLAVNSKKPALALVSLVPTGVFWILDTYYLRSERIFRRFYEHVRTGGDTYVPFKMDAMSPDFLNSLTEHERKKVGWWGTLVRPTLAWLYAGLALAALVVALLSKPDHSPKASACPQRVTQLARHPGQHC